MQQLDTFYDCFAHTAAVSTYILSLEWRDRVVGRSVGIGGDGGDEISEVGGRRELQQKVCDHRNSTCLPSDKHSGRRWSSPPPLARLSTIGRKGTPGCKYRVRNSGLVIMEQLWRKLEMVWRGEGRVRQTCILVYTPSDVLLTRLWQTGIRVAQLIQRVARGYMIHGRMTP